jgi:uncharacterized protein with HEPN domain
VSSEREALRLADIIENIGRIDDYLGAMSFAAFSEDAKTIDAVERCLQRISEAVIKLGEARMAEIAPSLPVHAVRGLRNTLRHDYDRVDVRTIFTTARDSPPSLRADCERALAQFE